MYAKQRRLQTRSVSTRVLFVMIVLGGSLSAAYLVCTSPAGADTYCTPQIPYAPYESVCTGGWGNSCALGLNCSPVPGTPGTWNPGGYTPACDVKGCP